MDSKADANQLYHVFYKDKYVSDLNKYPDYWIRIVTIPNQGHRPTAAGHHLFLNTTWVKKAQQYHLKSSGVLWCKFDILKIPIPTVLSRCYDCYYGLGVV